MVARWQRRVVQAELERWRLHALARPLGTLVDWWGPGRGLPARQRRAGRAAHLGTGADARVTAAAVTVAAVAVFALAIVAIAQLVSDQSRGAHDRDHGALPLVVGRRARRRHSPAERPPARSRGQEGGHEAEGVAGLGHEGDVERGGDAQRQQRRGRGSPSAAGPAPRAGPRSASTTSTRCSQSVGAPTRRKVPRNGKAHIRHVLAASIRAKATGCPSSVDAQVAAQLGRDRGVARELRVARGDGVEERPSRAGGRAACGGSKGARAAPRARARA